MEALVYLGRLRPSNVTFNPIGISVVFRILGNISIETG